MKVFKKLFIMFGMFSMLISGGGQLNSALAISDEAIEIRNKTRELAELVIDYYVGESTENFSGLCNFIKKLNEKQLKIFKNSFSWGFPKILYDVRRVNLSISVNSLDLLVAAVQSADLEFVKLVVENFDIPDINETDSCGCGSPLWCAVCLADEKNVDDATVESIVDYLLSVGADPYSDKGKGYIPDLFKNTQCSAPRMILKETFKKYGYGDIC